MACPSRGAPIGRPRDVDEVMDRTAPTITLRLLRAFDLLQLGRGLMSFNWSLERMIALLIFRDRPLSRLGVHLLLSDEAPCDDSLGSAPRPTYPPLHCPPARR
jgi:hypothetical protein